VSAPKKIRVVFPLCQKDGALLLENLKWQTELDGVKDFCCNIAVESGTQAGLVGLCINEASRTFREVRTFPYPRAPKPKWPNAPNWVFQHTARYMQRQNDPWFWMEPDCVALRPGWLTIWNERYFASRKPIMGYVIPRMGHCNGTAVYPANFPSLSRRAMTCSEIAWDGLMKSETIHLTANAPDLMCHVWGIKNGQAMICGGEPAVFATQAHVDAWVNPNAVLFHRSKNTTHIERLRERRNENLNSHCHASQRPILLGA
jgi:hypothetical protein